jgi:hydrogenase expression/formation protein HypC
MCLGVPGKIVAINGMTAKVSFNGAVQNVSLLFQPDAKVGEYGLVHAGSVLEIIDEKRADEIIGLLGNTK